MSVIQINKQMPKQGASPPNLGFRPFFLGAALFAIVSIALWMPVYFSYIFLPLRNLSSFQWHSHEMIYGYGMAVIAGFLLTAIMNWTGVQTISGRPLLGLFLCWLTARVLFLFGARFLEIAALADMLFMLGLLAAVSIPVVHSRNWKQLGVVSKVVFLLLGNMCFYLGALGFLKMGAYWGIYGGLYIIVALILTIGGRVIPGFIRNGLDYEVELSNPRWIAAVNLVLFIPFFINQLFSQDKAALGYLSLGLFVINAFRLILWHTPGIWKKPLLWSLYLSLVFIDLGFLLFALTAFAGVSPYIAVHAFAFGGIGIATISMMARVSLGHTGRNIRSPSKITSAAITVLTIGAVLRIVFPLFDAARYPYWIFLAQLSWITAFALFCMSHAKILSLPHLDAQKRKR